MKLKVPLGSGLKTCGCRACGEVFTSPTGFDSHQRFDPFRCLPPVDVGLVRKPNGKWSLPGKKGRWPDG